MDYLVPNDYLMHHGILGMKWGIRRFQPYSVNPRSSGKNGKEIGEAAHKKHQYKPGEKMSINDNDSSVTKRVKKDYNEMSDKDFHKKYKTSKDVYRKRVNKHGDPYTHAQKTYSKLNNNNLVSKLGERKVNKILSNHEPIDSKKVAKGAAIGAVAVTAILARQVAKNKNIPVPTPNYNSGNYLKNINNYVRLLDYDLIFK